MPFRLLAPKTLAPGSSYPLVLFFHGAGERGVDNESQLKHGTRLFLQPASREQFPCFVLAPQCPTGQQWVDMPWGTLSGTRPEKSSAAMQLALDILDRVCREYPVDASRLYVSGLSMGGYASWDCLTRFPGRFAAVVPVCGGGDEKTITPAAAKVPVWAFHSEDDNAVKVVRSRNMVEAMKRAGGEPNYFEYTGLGHNSWDRAYGEPEFLPWMFAQKLGQPDSFLLKTPAPQLPLVARWPAEDSLFPGQGPLQKAGWFQKLWRQKRLAWWQNRERDQGAVVFLGDSITQGWGALASDFPGLKTANRGISGDTTRGVRFRLQEDVLDLHPKAVVLLIGTNDLGLGGNPEDAAANLKAILSQLRQSSPALKIILCRVMPRGVAAGRFPETIQRLNQSLDTLSAEIPGVILCDTWSLFAGENGGPRKDEFPDLLHPNGLGYRKWAEALHPLLKQAGLE